MTPSRAPTSCEYASWTMAILGMLFVLHFRLLPALIAGMMVYELARAFIPVFSSHLSTSRARGGAVFLVILLAVGIAAAVVFSVIAYLKSEGGSLPVLLAKMADILQSSRAQLPHWLADYLPADTKAISNNLSAWLREHATELQRIGKETGHVLAHILIGMIVGAIISLNEIFSTNHHGPLAKALAERVFCLGEAFRRIVFAQVRISAINTALTALYLAVALPIFGISLPLTKTMIVVTFVVGMLPVLGNLFSNTVIFIISLAHSPFVAISSLSFLVLIHKLEYFLNARIVGSHINAKAWELLTAMVVMESAFGLAGLVAAPFCYAWLKDELKQRNLL